jgi:hypothetical protein
MRTLLRLLAVVVVLAVGVSGAVAVTAAEPESTPYLGEKIDLIVHDGKMIKFPPNEDFHIVHGFACEKAAPEYRGCMGPRTNFTLIQVTRNGVARVMRTTYLEEETKTHTSRRWYMNFPGGFRGGDRTFAGVWNMAGVPEPLSAAVKMRFKE